MANPKAKKDSKKDKPSKQLAAVAKAKSQKRESLKRALDKIKEVFQRAPRMLEQVPRRVKKAPQKVSKAPAPKKRKSKKKPSTRKSASASKSSGNLQASTGIYMNVEASQPPVVMQQEPFQQIFSSTVESQELRLQILPHVNEQAKVEPLSQESTRSDDPVTFPVSYLHEQFSRRDSVPREEPETASTAVIESSEPMEQEIALERNHEAAAQPEGMAPEVVPSFFFGWKQ